MITPVTEIPAATHFVCRLNLTGGKRGARKWEPFLLLHRKEEGGTPEEAVADIKAYLLANNVITERDLIRQRILIKPCPKTQHQPTEA